MESGKQKAAELDELSREVFKVFEARNVDASTMVNILAHALAAATLAHKGKLKLVIEAVRGYYFALERLRVRTAREREEQKKHGDQDRSGDDSRDPDGGGAQPHADRDPHDHG